MSKAFNRCQMRLRESPKVWLVTGVAGFIGSNLLEWLLENKQQVVGLDNYATGYPENLADVRDSVGSENWKNFLFIEGDIRDLQTCRDAVRGVDHVLHQAALGPERGALDDPLSSHDTNVKGLLNMLVASCGQGVSSFTYAASSSTYEDLPTSRKVKDCIGEPLLPYSVTKIVNELYASMFARNYGFRSVGLRYSNVFGPRQDSKSPYAAVIPRWMDAMLADRRVTIDKGDRETGRDFCYVANVVQANVLAAMSSDEAKDRVYDVAVGGWTNLNELFDSLTCEMALIGREYNQSPHYGDDWPVDVRHSETDIGKTRDWLGYQPTHDTRAGLAAALPWYCRRSS